MNFKLCQNLLFSEEIAEVKTELEEEGFTSDEAVKLIQQVYRKIGGFDNKSIDNKSKKHSYPVHEKVSGQFQISKYLYYGNRVVDFSRGWYKIRKNFA